MMAPKTLFLASFALILILLFGVCWNQTFHYPIDLSYFALLLGSLLLLALEIFIVSGGLLFVAGLFAFFYANWGLYDQVGLLPHWSLLLAFSAAIGLVLLYAYQFISHLNAQPTDTGANRFVGQFVSPQEYDSTKKLYSVKIGGEIWQAKLDKKSDTLKPKQKAKIVGSKGLVLKIKPVYEKEI